MTDQQFNEIKHLKDRLLDYKNFFEAIDMKGILELNIKPIYTKDKDTTIINGDYIKDNKDIKSRNGATVEVSCFLDNISNDQYDVHRINIDEKMLVKIINELRMIYCNEQDKFNKLEVK